MTWQGYDPPRGNRKHGWVSISSNSRGRGSFVVIVAFAQDVGDFLGVEPGSLVTVERGTGEHAGWLRLRNGRGKDGISVYRNNARGKSYRIRFNARSFGVQGFHSAHRVHEWDVFRGIDKRGAHVSFELPKWASKGVNDGRVRKLA